MRAIGGSGWVEIIRVTTASGWGGHQEDPQLVLGRYGRPRQIMSQSVNRSDFATRTESPADPARR